MCLVAYKRYLDNVHEIVDYKLVRGVARELLPSLCRYVSRSHSDSPVTYLIRRPMPSLSLFNHGLI